MRRSGCAYDHLTKLTYAVCFSIHLVKLGRRQLEKLGNCFRFSMLAGPKFITIHGSRVRSLAGAHTTAVDFKTVMHHCVCYYFKSENVPFNPVLNESMIRYSVSSSDILEETKIISLMDVQNNSPSLLPLPFW